MALYVRPAAATCRSSGSGAQEPSRGLPSDPREMGSWGEIWVPPYSDSGGVVFLLLVSILKMGIQIEFCLRHYHFACVPLIFVPAYNPRMMFLLVSQG